MSSSNAHQESPLRLLKGLGHVPLREVHNSIVGSDELAMNLRSKSERKAPNPRRGCASPPSRNPSRRPPCHPSTLARKRRVSLVLIGRAPLPEALETDSVSQGVNGCIVGSLGRRMKNRQAIERS